MSIVCNLGLKEAPDNFRLEERETFPVSQRLCGGSLMVECAVTGGEMANCAGPSTEPCRTP